MAAVGVIAMTTGFMIMAVTAPAQADDKTNVCHATGSDTNPYEYFSVGADGAGHVQHRGADSNNMQYWHEDTTWHGELYEAGTPKYDLVEGLDGEVPSDDEAAEDYCLAPGTTTDCDDDVECVTAVAPKVVQSSECEVQGTYTIEDTKGVDYYLDGDKIQAGTYDGPESGTVTAKADDDDYELTNPDFSYELDVEEAADCVPGKPDPIVVTSSVPSTDCDADVVTIVTTTTTTDYVLVGNQWVQGTPVTTTDTTTRPATDQECPPPIVAPVDVCPNIEGAQSDVPKGMTQNSKGNCVEPEVAGTEEPKPTEAVPTAVAAGLPGGPTFTSSSPTDLLAKSIVGAGLALLMAAGWLQIGRQSRGVHQV